MVNRLSTQTGCVHLDISNDQLCCCFLHSFIPLGLRSDAIHVCRLKSSCVATIDVRIRDCCNCFRRHNILRVHAFATGIRRHGGSARNFLLFSNLRMDNSSNNYVLDPSLHKTYSHHESSLRQGGPFRSSYVHNFKRCGGRLQLLARQGRNHHASDLTAATGILV